MRASKILDSSTLRATRWLGLAIFLLTFSMFECRLSIGQRLVRSTGALSQQSSSSESDATPPVLTPELYADLMVAHQRYDEAIAAYKKLTPQTASIYNKIGMAYQHLSMNTDARYSYLRAIKMDRKYAAAYNNLGTLEYHEKDNKHAERLYRKSIKLDSKTAPFWSNLGAAYLADRKYRDGAEAYQRAFILDSGIFQDIALNGIHEYASEEDLAKMNLCFAEIYAQAGMKDMALLYLRKALDEGFRDRQSIQQNQQFAGLRGDPAFVKLVDPKRK